MAVQSRDAVNYVRQHQGPQRRKEAALREQAKAWNADPTLVEKEIDAERDRLLGRLAVEVAPVRRGWAESRANMRPYLLDGVGGAGARARARRREPSCRC